MKHCHIFSKNIVYLIILYSRLFGIYLFIFLCFIWINKTIDVEIQRFFFEREIQRFKMTQNRSHVYLYC